MTTMVAAPAKMSLHKKFALAYVGVLVGLTVIGIAAGGDGETPAGVPVAAATTMTVAEPVTVLTVSEQNAVEMASDYLEYSAFSRSGLINQLEYDGFTTDQADHGTTQVGL
ncbi:Ltp family lipoprotein [Actinoplanes derwentensis]|uniref:Host cell surface-exposed lipoprotein n=1 Tax=Actinoplanes derwentensis TaxID=113562 RepID=A0A1H1ULV5_9ACTN|nr:Ltp family lipoprotein [Actinoplanes derwentensis]SDS73281.1 Host cell surface-exposed lipoprotein [Actinoplanes derwentensis]